MTSYLILSRDDYSGVVQRGLCLLFYKAFIWVCVIGGKEAVILNVQPDEPPESPGRKSEHPIGESLRVFTCLYVHIDVIEYHCYQSSVLTAGEGAEPQLSSSDAPNPERSPSAVPGGGEEAPPSKEEPEDLREEDGGCQDGGQSLTSLNLTSLNHQSQQEERERDTPPSARPPAGCCQRRTFDPDGADEPPEDGGDQEDEEGVVREEISSVSGSSLVAAGSLQEQVEAEPGQEVETGQGAESGQEAESGKEAEPSEETPVGFREGE